MSQYVSTPTKAFTAGAAIGQWIRVKIASGKLAVAISGGTDEVLEVGVMTEETFADLDIASVLLRSSSGTTPMVASGAITAGVEVYGDAAGKITATSTSNGASLGVALETSAADGDIIEVLRT